jgi:hypothetical protein
MRVCYVLSKLVMSRPRRSGWRCDVSSLYSGLRTHLCQADDTYRNVSAAKQKRNLKPLAEAWSSWLSKKDVRDK